MRLKIDPASRERFINGSTGYRALTQDKMSLAIGYMAKVANCPILGTELKLTCYAISLSPHTGSVHAYTRYKGTQVPGYLAYVNGLGITFRPKFIDQVTNLKLALTKRSNKVK